MLAGCQKLFGRRLNGTATKLMKKMLTQQRRLAGTIYEDSRQYNAETNQVDMSFKVDLGPSSSAVTEH
jgi:hypothetical protein